MNANDSTITEDLYEVLQVSASADPEVIAAAHDRLSRKYGSDLLPEIREKRRALDAAYAVLSNAARRAEYDGSRGIARPASAPPPVAAPSRGVVACPRDPGMQTALRCSRCEMPICPKCLVQTPVGARCRDCARIAHSPIYTLSAMHIVRAGSAALIGGVVMGLIWGFILLPFSVGFFSIFLGAGLGYVFTRAMEFATGRKRGPVVVAFAIGGILIAWSMQFLFVPPRVALYGIVAVGVAIYFAYQNLRYV
jgi:DnaJ domain